MKKLLIFSFFLISLIGTGSVYSQVSILEVDSEVNDKLSEMLKFNWDSFKGKSADTEEIYEIGGWGYKAYGTFLYTDRGGFFQKTKKADFIAYFQLKAGDIKVYKLCVINYYSKKKCKTFTD